MVAVLGLAVLGVIGTGTARAHPGSDGEQGHGVLGIPLGALPKPPEEARTCPDLVTGLLGVVDRRCEAGKPPVASPPPPREPEPRRATTPAARPKDAGKARTADRPARRTVALRLLPLGDSITYGLGASDSGGYRGELWRVLEGEGGRVDFVGSVRSGRAGDPDHEGHPGWRIDQIDRLATACTVARYRPNVVTLHIGTNDMNHAYDVGRAPARLHTLIDDIFRAAPRTTVLVATLVPSVDPLVNARIRHFNSQIPGIVAELEREGKYVRTVDMSAVTPADLHDWLHPGSAGYRKVAAAFVAGIHAAIADGWIMPPVRTAPGRCAPKPERPGGLRAGFWDWQSAVASGASSPSTNTHVPPAHRLPPWRA
ncbi:hypothetical protein SRB5_54050 [Streptomyces sp. RB5]|uniref:SGNH hydrolase-type esterase domain-containing protein n=2 Tax=Streptomyces smaragdinus TaxID=2585196 RepID=A0A7K0CP08_9ACTN|nr:hypothetical protein [Streptomyces smaragdinus]